MIKQYPLKSPKSGFTLLELSISLIIIGFIIAGIITGKSIIQGGEYRAVASEFLMFASAFNTFQDQFGGLPGDLANADEIWPEKCVDEASGPNKCSGNGNGWIDGGQAAGNEGYRAWQHMALANIIAGEFSGKRELDGGEGGGAKIGVNMPASKIKGGGWRIGSIAPYENLNPNWFNRRGHVLSLGSTISLDTDPESNITSTNGHGPLLTPRDARAIDLKIDDGSADSGSVIGIDGGEGGNTRPCIEGNPPGEANYDLSIEDPNCVLGFFLE